MQRRRQPSLDNSCHKNLDAAMNAKDAIRASANLSMTVLKSYLSDLSDSELLMRPAKGCNHIAHQLGHLISSEVHLLEMVAPGKSIGLPEGFAEAHSKERASDNDPAHFHDKATYLSLFDKVRGGTLAALEAFSESDLDKEGPEAMRRVCPTAGDFFTLIATHPMMHAGQFVILRRQLDKPILM
jgi:hypothetical protein